MSQLGIAEGRLVELMIPRCCVRGVQGRGLIDLGRVCVVDPGERVKKVCRKEKVIRSALRRSDHRSSILGINYWRPGRQEKGNKREKQSGETGDRRSLRRDKQVIK